MLTNLIRLVIVRGVLTLVIDNLGSQLLESNRSLNRLLHIIVHGDGDSLSAISTLRGEGMTLGLTQNSLAVFLGNQLSIQGVFLTRNQTLIRNLVHNLGTSNNFLRTILKVRVRRNNRILVGSYGLVIIIDVAVIGNLLLFIRVRSFLTVLVDLLGVEVLECDGRLDDALHIVVDLDVNDLLTGRLLRGEGYIALADDLVLTLIILSLVTQLSLQGVFLTRNQVGVGNGVLDGDASLYLLSVVKVSVGLNGRGPLGVNGLLLIVDVFVSSNHVFIGGASGLVAVLIYLGRYQLLEGNRSVDSRICLVVDGNLNVLFTGGLFRNQFLGAFTQYGFAIFLGDQLCLQGVLLSRNKVFIRHSVNNRGALFHTVSVLDGSFRFNLGLKILFLLASSRSRFWIRYYISRLIRSRLGGGVLRSGPLRTRRLRILGRSARRGLTTRVLRSSHIRWLLLRSCGLFRATTIVRQTRLINWDYSLTTTFMNIPYTVRADNSNKGVSRLTLNSHRRVNFKPCI